MREEIGGFPYLAAYWGKVCVCVTNALLTILLLHGLLGLGSRNTKVQ